MRRPGPVSRWRRSLRLHGPDARAEIDEELRFHLDERAARYERAGLAPADARSAAGAKMGDLDDVRRECLRQDRATQGRRRRRERVSTVRDDVRYGWRALKARPVFTGAAVLTLGLGVGATAGVVSTVDAVLWKPLPYPTEERIAVLWELIHEWQGRTTVAPGKVPDWQAAASFDALAVLTPVTVTLTRDGEPERVPAMYASGEVAAVFGLPPVEGRWFTRDEALSDARVVVLGADLRTGRYGGIPEILGHGVYVDGVRHEVIGVMPGGFAPMGDADLWVPLGPLPDAREAHYLRVAGLLARDTDLAAAQAEMTAIAQRLEAAYPDTDADDRIEIVPLREEVLGDATSGLMIWMGAVVLVLLIGAANCTNLLLARAHGRVPEVALRRSLGASRLRLVRQLLIENLLLGGIAGVVAIGLAVLVRTGLAALQPGTLPRVPEGLVDWRIVAGTVALGLAAGLVAGILPAVRLSGRAGAELAGGLPRGSIGEPRRDRVMAGLISAEVGVAVVLMTGAALLIQTLRSYGAVDPGFEIDDRVAFRVSLPSARYPSYAEMRAFYDDIRRELGAVPGVEAVGGANGIPLEGVPWFQTTSRDVGADGEPISMSAPFRVATPGYFEAAGISLLAGRDFDARDREGGTPSVVLERRLAEQLYPDGDPLGRVLDIAYGDVDGVEVIGVVSDVRQFGLGSAATPGLYVPVGQIGWSSLTFLVATELPPEVIVAAVRAEVARLDPELPVYGVGTVEDRVATSLAEDRFRMLVLTTFAGLALLLGLVGVYGVLAYAVSRRSREIGIRLALGAGPGRVVRSVVVWGAALGAVGLAIGIAGAIGLTRTLESQLYGVGPRDPAVFAVVAALTGVAVLGAAWLPARRAARLDPATTLRHE